MPKPESNTRLLCVPAGWESYLSGEFSEIHDELEKKGWHKRVIGETSDQELISCIGHADSVLLWEAYEFRQFCALKLDKTVCEVLDHPGYPGDRANLSTADEAVLQRVGRKGYARVLRSYPAMLVCGSIFDYLVAKVFEGMAAGCLTLCDRTSLGKQLGALGFVDGEHYIGTGLASVIEDSETIFRLFSDNPDRYRDITRAAADKVRRCHSASVRATQIDASCTGRRGR